MGQDLTSALPVAAAPPARPIARLAALAVAAALLATAGWLADRPDDGRTLSFWALAGGLFGLVLQRSRFCFYCLTRDYFERRDARGLLGLLAALAVGTLGYHVVFGIFLPIPGGGRLPPGAHIGPVSWVLAAGAAAFGLGMAAAGSCISAHFYRLGEGSVASLFALAGAAAGFVLGFASWNTLYEAAVRDAPVIWLPHHLGYGGSAGLQLLGFGLLAWLLARRHRPPAAAPLPARPTLFGARWPTYAGGLLVGAIGTVAYLRSAPLGVTAELGSLARTAASHWHLLPERLQGLDGYAGCATVVKEALLSNNGVFVLSLVGGSLASALAAGEFRPSLPAPRDILRHLGGGLLMGWGAMVALGCTVGTLLSGTMAGAASGWLFGAVCLAATWVGWRLRRR